MPNERPSDTPTPDRGTCDEKITAIYGDLKKLAYHAMRQDDLDSTVLLINAAHMLDSIQYLPGEDLWSEVREP